MCENIEKELIRLQKELQEVNDEIDLYEEDYREDLLDRKKILLRQIDNLNKLEDGE